MLTTTGLHHITAITADPQRNVDFYEGFLGQRFVKKTVNFDDPSAYHLYYGDYVGSPGTAMTFFSWSDMPQAIPGSGETNAIYYRIPAGGLDYWRTRAETYGVPAVSEVLFGESVLALRDPDNHRVYLIEVPEHELPDLTLWTNGPVPEQYQVRGFYGVRIAVQRLEMLAPLLTEVLGYVEGSASGDLVRFSLPGTNGNHIDIESMPDALPARQGVGSIHHIALRAEDDAQREAFRSALLELGLQPTGLVDRTFFHSTYVWTPARVLFEIATDSPGFTVNESADRLGEQLVLPEQYEGMRTQIEAHLPLITLPRHGAHT